MQLAMEHQLQLVMESRPLLTVHGNICDGRKSSADPLYTNEVLSSISSKTFMLESKSCIELQSTLNCDKREEKNHRHKLFSELQDQCGSRKVAKT